MTISTSDAGKQLAAARVPKERHCAVCGKAFVTVGRGIYCSEAHRQRAKYLRNLEKQSRKSG